MIGFFLASLLAAGPGASLRAAPAASYDSMGGYFFGVGLVGRPRSTRVTPDAGSLVSIAADKVVTGADGGGSTFTLAVTADGVPACTLAVPCVGVENTTGTCSATFSAGADLHLEVTASDCSDLPEFIASATWSY